MLTTQGVHMQMILIKAVSTGCAVALIAWVMIAIDQRKKEKPDE